MRKQIAGWLVAALVGVGAMSAHATTVSVDMAPGGAVDPLLMVAPGDSFDLNIVVESFTDLAGFQFDLGFDAAVLDATLATSGSFFGASTFGLVNTIIGNTVSFGETILDPGITGAGPSVLVLYERGSEGVAELVSQIFSLHGHQSEILYAQIWPTGYEVTTIE